MLHILFSLVLAASALPTDSSRLKLGDAPDVPPRDWSARLTLFDSQYVSAGTAFYRGDAADNNRGATVGLAADPKWKSFGASLNLRDEFSASERWNYLDVYDAHVSWRPWTGAEFALGRKLERWNEWEKDWRQGVFQPRYMQNRLRGEEAGLTGLFYRQEAQPAVVSVGLLPIAIPEMGAHQSVENDQFVSKNPWFNPPAKQFEYRQVVSDIRYSAETPSLGEAILHPGAVAKVEFSANKIYFGRLSGAYKPMPQFLLGFPSRGRVIIRPDEDFMSVRIKPRFVYHALISHDSVVNWGAWTVRGSLTREVPDRDASPADYTAQQVAPAWIYAASVSRPLEAEGPFASRMKFGFLKVEGGDARDRGDFAAANSLFERRYQYLEAYSLGLAKSWRGLAVFPLDTEIRLIYDRKQNGGVAQLALGMNFSRSFRADFEADFLGLLSGPAEVEDGFLALYRANDRVGVGLSYVY